MMGTVRFSKIVETAGKPIVHLLWMDPAKDLVLQKAIHANRVMTVHQGQTNAKADYGTIGFQKGLSGQILIFPKSLKPFADKQVIGVKYDLLEWPAVPKSQQARKVIPVKHSAKAKPQDTKISATAEQAALAENATAKVVKLPNPEDDHEDGPTTDVEELKNQVRLAMKVLEEGKQVAAFNLLKRIVDS
jgi:hypothetical protein